MHSLLRWLTSITIILSFNYLVSCQILGDTLGGVGSLLDTILVPAATTTPTPQQQTTAVVVQNTPTAAAPVTTAVATTAKAQTPANVLVTDLVQTTIVSSKSTIITSKVSLPIIPSITADGSTTWSVGTDIYTVVVKDGQTSIIGHTATDGRTVRLSQSVVAGMPVIISFMDVTQTLVATSVITQALASTPTTSPTGHHHQSSQGLSAGAGIGIGVGLSVLLLGIIGAIIFFVLKRRKARQSKDDSSIREMMGAASVAEDGSGAESFGEKAELDGHSIHFVQHEPIELLGSIPPPIEIDGRELYRPETPKAAIRRADTVGSRSDGGTLISPLDGTFPSSPEGMGGIRRMDTVSTMHYSPTDRNHGVFRDEKWPPVPPPYRDREDDHT